LIIVGALIFLGSFSIVSSWLIDWFPALADIEGALSKP
jgi:cytochrome c-type biogenesis protein